MTVTYVTHPELWEVTPQLHPATKEGIHIDDVKYAQFRKEADAIYPHLSSSQRDIAAMHLVLTHPGFHSHPVPPLKTFALSDRERQEIGIDASTQVQRIAQSVEAQANDFHALSGAFGKQYEKLEQAKEALATGIASLTGELRDILHTQHEAMEDALFAHSKSVETALKENSNAFMESADQISMHINSFRVMVSEAEVKRAREKAEEQRWNRIWRIILFLLFLGTFLFAMKAKAEPRPDELHFLNAVRRDFGLPQIIVPPSGSFDSSGNLLVNCITGCSASSGFADNGAFTVGTTPINIMGGYYTTGAAPTLTNGSAGRARIDANSYLFVDCAAGCAGGTFNNNSDAVATSATNGQSAAWLYGFNGTTWDRLRSDTNKYLYVTVGNTSIPVTGTFWQATQPVSGTFWQATQPVSCATAATCPTLAQPTDGTTPVAAAVSAMGTAPTGTEVMMVNSTIFGKHGTTYSPISANSGSLTFAADVNLSGYNGATIANTNPVPTLPVDGTNAMGVMANFGTSPGAVKAINNNVSLFQGTTAVGAAAPLQVSLANTGSNGTALTVSGGSNIFEVSPTTGANTVSNPFFTQISNGTNSATFNSTATAGKYGLDTNILSILGTAPTTAGFLDIKGADGNVFVRQTTAANLNATVVGGKTNNNAAPGATNVGVLPAIANAAVQTWTEGDQVLESVDLSGNQRAILGGTAVVTNAASTSYTAATASTNATNVKNAAGNIYSITATNTTATVYYLRLYNLSSAPTCSSATGFVETIPVGGASSGSMGGLVRTLEIGQAFSTGIGFCITGGSSSTDNTNAAAGVYVTVLYK